MVKLSVVIITLNEERNIGRCLASVESVADEIIVVDSGSTDNTQNLCKVGNVQFSINDFKGHIEQKNYALSMAKYPHVLSLDADEALSDELKQSILKVKNKWEFDGYSMNRLTNYCGKWIKHSGWYPDSKLRLFNRDKGEWGGVNPHDKFIMKKDAAISFLKGDLLHYSYYTVEEHRERTLEYSEVAAQQLFALDKKTLFIRPYLSAIAKFIRTYIKNFGFLDGQAGYRISKIGAWGTYHKYSKLLKAHNTHKNL